MSAQLIEGKLKVLTGNIHLKNCTLLSHIFEKMRNFIGIFYWGCPKIIFLLIPGIGKVEGGQFNREGAFIQINTVPLW